MMKKQMICGLGIFLLFILLSESTIADYIWQKSTTYSDNFTDGDFTNNPTWAIASGGWQVNPNFQLQNNASLDSSIAQENTLTFFKNEAIYSFLINLSIQNKVTGSGIGWNMIGIGGSVVADAPQNGYKTHIIANNVGSGVWGIYIERWSGSGSSIYDNRTVLTAKGCPEPVTQKLNISFYRNESGYIFVGCNNATGTNWITIPLVSDTTYNNTNLDSVIVGSGYAGVDNTTFDYIDIYSWGESGWPSMNEVSISPLAPLTNETILGFCNASDPNNFNVTYNWTFYINGAEYASGQSINLTPNIAVNIANVSAANTSYEDNITLSCMASNGMFETAWMNGSVIIANSFPNDPILNYPGNDFANVSTEAVLNVTVTDHDGHTMNVSFYNSTGGLIGTVADVANGSNVNVTWSGLYIGTDYSWYVNITDGINMTQGPLWNFTTFAAYTITIPNGYYNQSGTFILNINKSGVISDINATLIHNGTAYAATKTQSGDFFIFTQPIIPLATGTLEAYWKVNLTDGDTIRSYNISSNQSVTDWAIDNCTLSNNITLTMTIYSENTPATHLNGSVELEFVYWVTDSSLTKTYSKAFDGSYTYNLCITPSNFTIRADAYILYTIPGGFTHRYYIRNGSFTNVTQNISLYNFNSTDGMSDLKITARYQANNNYFPNVIAKLERLYVSESVWRTVQMDESGDFGQIFFNIMEEDTDYRIIFQDRNNNILKTTEKMKFLCTSGICDLTFLLPTEPENATVAYVATSWNYDNNSGLINITWEEIFGTHVTVGYSVTKETMTGTTIICSESQTGAAGNMSCDVSFYSGLVLLSISGPNSTSQWIELQTAKLVDYIGDRDGSFLAFGILLTCAAFGAFSPMSSIISIFIGLIVVYFLGISTPITMTFIILVCALSIAIGMKVRN